MSDQTQLDNLFRAWAAASVSCSLGPPAPASGVEAWERERGVCLPVFARDLFRRSNGCSIAGGNVEISLIEAPIRTGSAGWKHEGWPERFVYIGSDGSDAQYGLWITDGLASDAPVISVTEYSWFGGSVRLAASSLSAMLTARTAFHLLIQRSSPRPPKPHTPIDPAAPAGLQVLQALGLAGMSGPMGAAMQRAVQQIAAQSPGQLEAAAAEARVLDASRRKSEPARDDFDAAFQALSLPKEFLAIEQNKLNDETYASVLRWADPSYDPTLARLRSDPTLTELVPSI